MENKVFLGGTCNGDTWRDELIPLLKVPYFNPVVEDWNEEARAEERTQKDLCNIHLYCITSKMTGVYSIAEAVESAHKGHILTIFNVCIKGFSSSQKSSLKSVGDMICKCGGTSVGSSDRIEDVILRLSKYINALK